MYLPIVSTITLLQVQSVKAYHTIYLFYLYLRALTQSTSPTFFLFIENFKIIIKKLYNNEFKII